MFNPNLHSNRKVSLTLTKFSALFFSFLLFSSFSFSQTAITTREGCKCIFRNADKIVEVLWSGKCVNGYANGKGKQRVYYNDGTDSYFEGNMKDGVRDGHGVFVGSKKDKYQGQFVNGRFEGKGTYTWADGGKYEGEWKNSEMNGKGTRHYKDGGKYVGDFVSNKREGYGIMYLKNGNRYEGEFKDGQYEGQGTYYWANGNVYTGEWKNSKREGMGVLTFDNGEKQSGEWKEGELIRDTNVDQSLFSIGRPDILKWHLSLNLEGTSNVIYIENTNALPQSNDYYRVRTVPFFGYKANLKVGTGILGANLHYEDNNLKPSFNNAVVEDKMEKTMQRVIKFAGYLPIHIKRRVSVYSEYLAMKFQNRFEVNQPLLFSDNTLQSGRSYVYSNNYKEYLFGLKGINFKSDIKAELTSGFIYSTIYMPHFNSIDTKIEPIQSKKLGTFLKYEFKNDGPKKFFDTQSYGYKYDIGFSRIELEDRSFLLFDNKKDLLFTGSTAYSKHHIAKHVTLSLSGTYRSLTPASTFDKVLFGTSCIFTAVAGSIQTFQISKYSYGNSLQEASWFSAARVILTPILNYSIIKVDNYLHKWVKGRDLYDIAQSELFYSISLNIYL
jgi:hypothetical protein